MRIAISQFDDVVDGERKAAFCGACGVSFAEEPVVNRDSADALRTQRRRVTAGPKSIRYGTAYVALAASEKWWVM